MTKLRVAIFSATGTARKRTIPAIKELGLCDILAIHGRNESKLVAIAEENSIPYYFLDESTLIKEVTPDFVYIGSPPNLHMDQIQLCLNNNIPVLCEKPLAITSVEVRKIRSLYKGKDIPIRIAHHLRHQPSIKVLKSIISQGKLGELRRASMQWGFWLNDLAPNASWKLDPKTGGPDAFYDAGIHVVDLLIHLLPKPTAITALSYKSRFSSTIDNVSALILCGNAIIELNASQSIRFPQNELSLDFENGSVFITHAFGEKAFTQMEISSAAGTITETYPSVNLYGEEIRDFIGLIKGQLSCGTTLEEAQQTLDILEAITKSYENFKTVYLPR